MGGCTAIGVALAHEGKLDERFPAGLQVALLYTTIGGQRRLRIHNTMVPVTSSVANVFRTVELDTVVNLMAKQGVPVGAHRDTERGGERNGTSVWGTVCVCVCLCACLPLCVPCGRKEAVCVCICVCVCVCPCASVSVCVSDAHVGVIAWSL
jgi:hypothetical protein